ncbi:MAG: hypothetical protein ACM3XO_12730 [Bacteroidota bacterium]
MSTQNSAIELAQPADSIILASALDNLRSTLFAAATANIEAALGDEVGSYTALERQAMIATEALRLTSGMDLSTIITRGGIIRDIEQQGLVGVHPNGYANLTALAMENNISVAELSDIRALCDVIFPYITEVLELNLIAVWDEVGKSTFREMVPALRSLITGQNADHNSVRNAVEGMLNNAAISLAEAQEVSTSEIPDVDVRRQAVISLLHEGATMPVRDMRRRVRPTPVPHISMTTMQTREDQWYAVLRITSQEQYDLIMRILNSHTDNQLVSGRGDGQGEYRRLLGSFFGDRE